MFKIFSMFCYYTILVVKKEKDAAITQILKYSSSTETSTPLISCQVVMEYTILV